MKKQQTGFTLIELVMVIVILGILAAVALPRFINMRQDAAQAAVNGVAGALSSASAINYAARTANVVNGVPIGNCNQVANALQGGLPTTGGTYTVTAAGVAVNATVNCTLTLNASGTIVTAIFVAIGIA